MNARHAVITGAAGFLGGACVEEFLLRGWRVLALVHRRVTPQLRAWEREGRIDIARANIRCRRSLLAALRTDSDVAAGSSRALVHCAGRASDVGRDGAFRRDNLVGTQNVCEAVQCLDIGRLVHVSTTDVYGVRDFEEADETTPHRNNRGNPYPKYKILAERVVSTGLPAERRVVLRPGLVWGPGDVTVLPRVLSFLRTSRHIVHFGGWRGVNRWPLAYVGNVARAAWGAAAWDAALGEAYNVVDPERTTMDEYYRMLAAIFLPASGPRRSVTLPRWVGFLLGAASSALTTLLDRDRPLLDPSLYGLHHVSHDQAFSHAKIAALLERHGTGFVSRAEALAQTHAWARAAPTSPLRPR